MYKVTNKPSQYKIKQQFLAKNRIIIWMIDEESVASTLIWDVPVSVKLRLL